MVSLTDNSHPTVWSTFDKVPTSTNVELSKRQTLKLVCTLLNYRVLGTSTAAIFFQMIIEFLSMHL